MEAEGCDIDQGDNMSDISLGWAACFGEEDVVEKLLQQDDTNPSERGKEG